jgi:hypothetical protein
MIDEATGFNAEKLTIANKKIKEVKKLIKEYKELTKEG